MLFIELIKTCMHLILRRFGLLAFVCLVAFSSADKCGKWQTVPTEIPVLISCSYLMFFLNSFSG